jgi:LPS export ABC transporter protein LptC
MRRWIAVLVASAIVIACTEKKALPTARGSALADSADQVMFGAKFTLTSEGVNRARLVTDTAYFFDDNTRIELDKVHTTFFNATGIKDAVLTSERGTYLQRLGNMLARKNVVVVSEDGRRLTTQELLYSTGRNEISSDSAFVLTEPNRRLEGIGFRSDPNMSNIRILKGASGVVRDVSTSPVASPQPPPTATSTPQR